MPEPIRETISDTIITEFRGNFPKNIPVRPGVDLEKLTEGDDNPFFLTLEISSEGRTSDNGLLHDREFGEVLVKQIMSKAAEGIMGHIKEEDKKTAYPVSDIHWIGSIKDGDKVWAKGYIPKTAVAQREHYRILTATNGKAATSVYGQAVKELVDARTGAWKAKDFDLEQLDLAPYTRAALRPQSGFIITKEMTNNEQETVMDDKYKIIRELTADDVDHLPKSVREAITASVPTPPEVALVTELRQELGEGDLLATVRELVQQRDAQKTAAVTQRITELVTEVKVDAVRPVVMELVAARAPQTVGEAEAAYKAVIESETVTELLSAHVEKVGGPPLRTGVQGQQQSGGKFFIIPRKEGGKWRQQ